MRQQPDYLGGIEGCRRDLERMGIEIMAHALAQHVAQLLGAQQHIFRAFPPPVDRPIGVDLIRWGGYLGDQNLFPLDPYGIGDQIGDQRRATGPGCGDQGTFDVVAPLETLNVPIIGNAEENRASLGIRQGN